MAFPEDQAQHSISHDGEEEGDRFVWRLPIYQPPTRQPLLPPVRAMNQKKPQEHRRSWGFRVKCLATTYFRMVDPHYHRR